MKTSHEFAKELLSLPDIAVWIYLDNADGEGHPLGIPPTAVHIEGYTKDGDDNEVIEIYGHKPVVYFSAS